MTEMLLVNFETLEAQQLERFLSGRGHRATILANGKSLVRALREPLGFDVVVVDVTADSPAVQRSLAELQTYRAQHGPRPMILCVSRVYRGPHFELELERKGARVAYVR